MELLKHINKQRGIFMLYNEIIMELTKKNKYYRALNEPLIHRFNELAEWQLQQEIKRGIQQEEFITPSQKTRMRGEKILSCGTYLELENQNGIAKITSGNFCHDKFCALCSRIRSMKRYSQMMNVLNVLRDKGIIYGNNEVIIGMITLTQKNVPINELQKELESLSTGIKRLTQTKVWKESIYGYAKSLEITYNKKSKTYHPHYHFLVVWDKEKYIQHSKTIQYLWKRSLRLKYFPECHITEAYGENTNLSKIINECLKYNIKASKENATPLYSDLSVNDFSTLLQALKHKRFVSYNGIIADIRRQLRYADEDTDKSCNVSINDDITLPQEVHKIVLHWSESQQQYIEYKR